MAVKVKWLVIISLLTALVLTAGAGLLPAEGMEDQAREELISEHYKQGLGCYRQKDYFQAKMEFDKVLVLDPQHRKAKKYSALILKKIEKNIARKGFSYREPAEGIASKTDLAGYLYEMGKGYYLLGQYQEASQKFRQILLVNSSHKGAQAYLEQIESGRSLEEIVEKEMVVRAQAKLEARRVEIKAESSRQAEEEAKEKIELDKRAEKEAEKLTKKKTKQAAKDVKQVAKDAKKAAKDAKKAAKEVKKAEKLAKKEAKEAVKLAKKKTKQAAKEVKKAEKLAKKEAKEAVKLAKKKTKQAAKDAKKAAKKAKKIAKEVKRAVKLAGKEEKEEKKQKEKLAREIARAEKLKDDAGEKLLLERAEGYYLEGRDCYKDRQYGEAIKLFQKALDLKPDYTKASRYLKKAGKKREKQKEKESKEKLETGNR